jgi:hypothetical protein
MMLALRIPVAIALLSTAVSAQSFTNGSLTSPISNGVVPAGWTVINGSPDTMDPNNNAGVPGLGAFGAAPSFSPNGGTWVGLGRDGVFFVEEFGQTVSGFSIGTSYTVSWFSSNFGYSDFDYVNPNFVQAQVNGTTVGAGASRPMATGWLAESVSFTATANTQTISFRLGSMNRSYMGIDGIALRPTTVVPEPSTYALLAAGLITMGIMRRRRAR